MTARGISGIVARPDVNAIARRSLDEIYEGLGRPLKELPCKYLYDARGSKLFDEICSLDEYYLTRTELGIMKAHIEDMSARIGPNALIIEYGCGSGQKTRLLLRHLKDPAGFIPIDISRAHLEASVKELRRTFPGLGIWPVCKDFTKPFTLPPVTGSYARRVVYFPGSTLGNFRPQSASAFLRRIARVSEKTGGLVIGIDLKKDRPTLEAAYNDARGVTAAFNLNLLNHVNRVFDADFDTGRFAHLAFYNEEEGCMEMHVVSRCAHEVTVGGKSFSLQKGERIRTEQSYKYSPDGFSALAGAAGLTVDSVWTDPKQLFSIQYLSVS